MQKPASSHKFIKQSANLAMMHADFNEERKERKTESHAVSPKHLSSCLLQKSVKVGSSKPQETALTAM
jgi:hypothetical protein